MNRFVGSDPHLGHLNILHYCRRPFRDLEHMNREIITRHNSRVKAGDLWICAGDFCFHNSAAAAARGEGDVPKWRHYWDQMNGDKILVSGNHDRNNSANTPVKMLFLEYGGFGIGITHRPSDVINKFQHVPANFWLVGHVHNSWPKTVLMVTKTRNILMVNISLDVWNFYPVKLEEIVGMVRKKGFKPVIEIVAERYLDREKHKPEK